MQIWQLEGQNRKKRDRDNQDFRILKRLPQTTSKSVENCENWAKYAVLTVWTFLFDQFSTDFDVVYGSVFRIRICRTLMWCFLRFWVSGCQICISINAKRKRKYLGCRVKNKKSGPYSCAHENSEENATDRVKIGPQTKMKIDFPFSRKTALENQVLLNIRQTAHDIGFFFFNQNFW